MNIVKWHFYVMITANKHHHIRGCHAIRINIHLTQEITWQHNTHVPRKQHEWPPFAMIIKESRRVLPRPSVVFHVKTSMGSPWLSQTPSHCIFVKWDKVSSNLTTVEATKFMRPYKFYMCQYIINLIHRGQMISHQSTQVGAITFRAPNMKPFHSPPFPSGILYFSLITSPDLT
jgi:hypothetical protein